MSDQAQKAIQLAARIPETVLNAVLDWGEAINKAEALPEGAAKESATFLARVCGQEVMRLGMGLAKTLRPAKPSVFGSEGGV